MAVVVALLLWTVYWAVVRRRRDRPWASGWVGVVIAAVAFVSLVPRMGESAERAQDVEAAVAGASVSDAVRECVEQAASVYDGASEATQRRIPWTRPQYMRIIGESCVEFERRGMMDDENPPSQATLNAITADVVARMQEDGELPPAG